MAGDDIHLKKNLTILDCVAIIVGSVIGSGIFISASSVVKYSGSTGFSFVIWIVAWFISLSGGFCYAELGSAIVKSGGEYTFVREAFGDVAAFVISWTLLLIIIPGSASVIALAFGEYSLKSVYLICEPSTSLVIIASNMAIIILAAINCVSVKAASRIQVIFTAAKVLSLIIIVCAGFYKLAMDPSIISRINFIGTRSNPGEISLALYSGIFSFSGWNCLNSISEEVKNPQRDIPRAIIISLSSVMGIYLFVNFAYFVVIPPQDIVSTNVIGLTFAEEISIYLTRSLPIFVMLSTFGSINGLFLSIARVFFVAGRDGNLPTVFSLVTLKFKTPVIAIIFSGLCSFVLISINNIDLLISFLTFAEIFAYTSAVAGLMYMRRRKVDYEPTFRVNIFFPIIFIAFGIFLTVMTLIAEPVGCGISFLIIMLGFPGYFIFVKLIPRSKAYNKFSVSFSRIMQSLLMADFSTQ